MKSVDRIIGKIALPIIGVACILLVLVFVMTAKGQSKENNGYIRVINCIISENAATRGQSDIEQCYRTVEKQTGVHLQRYDTSSLGK